MCWGPLSGQRFLGALRVANVLKPVRGHYIMACEWPAYSHLSGANKFFSAYNLLQPVRGPGSLVQ